MPKTSQAEKPVEPTKNPIESTTVETLLLQVIEELKGLRDAIAKPNTSTATLLNEPATLPLVAPASTPVAEQIPVPAGYRDEVDKTLNKSFGIEIEPHRDAPLVTVTISVPDKYSTLTPDQREMQPRDLRVKVITLAGGVAELKEYVDLVYKSFTPEIQAMITADRTANV